MPAVVDPALVHAVFADDGPLVSLMPGYRRREAQEDMALAVVRCLDGERGRLVVEAGTGTGKSLAYLVPLLLSGKRSVVATGTKALQDQLVDKDAPIAIAAVTAVLKHNGVSLAKPPQVVRVKGRGNYLCHVRYEAWERQTTLDLDDDGTKTAVALRDFANTTHTGDRAELVGLPEGLPIWGQLDASRDHCLGQSCPRYDDCYLVRSRRAAEAATVMVANHHLLCADLSLRQETDSGFHIGILPNYDAVVVDEAHGLRDVATDHFGASVSVSELVRFAVDLRRHAQSCGADENRRLTFAARDIEAHSRDFFDTVASTLKATPFTDGASAHGGAHGNTHGERGLFVVDDKLKHPKSDLDRALLDAGNATDAARATFDGTLDSDAMQRATFAGLKGRADRLRAALTFTTSVAPLDSSYVCLVDKNARDTTLTAAPIHVGGSLAASLFATTTPVVLTSATLATDDNAAAFQDAVGLSFISDDSVDSNAEDKTDNSDDDDDDALPEATIETLVFPSPFDHARRAALYVPTEQPQPDHASYATRFDEELLFLLELSRGGALVLFTSHRAMEDAARRLRPALTRLDLPLLKQGERPKAVLLDELRTNGNAALFATASFWEGIDVVGKALRLVVIDRLPFRVPSDPLVKARAEFAARHGKDPFRDLAVPEAALALKQGAGRLLRSVDDAGVVAILDGRLRQKSYGASFLRALPPMTRVGSRKTVTQFWMRYVEPALNR